MQNNTEPYLKPSLDDSWEYPINQENKVIVKQFSQYGEEYFDIFLYKNNDELFLGRYLRHINNLRIGYKDGKILIYYGFFDDETKKYSKVTKVINLYNMEDGLAYVGTEIELLKLFDPSLDTRELLEPNNSVLQYNIDNKQPKTKNLVRFSYDTMD